MTQRDWIVFSLLVLGGLVFIFKWWRGIEFYMGSTQIPVNDGWLEVNDKSINLVDQIKKIKGLKYKHVKEEGGMYHDGKEYVLVSDEVGKVIQLYLKADDYADMELFEFVSRIYGDQPQTG
jgi:hypothetical protein